MEGRDRWHHSGGLLQAIWPGRWASEDNHRQIGMASCLQALVFMEEFNYPDICCGKNPTGHRQSRRFLEYTDFNFLLQVVEETMRRGAMPHYSHQQGQAIGECEAQGQPGLHWPWNGGVWDPWGDDKAEKEGSPLCWTSGEQTLDSQGFCLVESYGIMP